MYTMGLSREITVPLGAVSERPRWTVPCGSPAECVSPANLSRSLLIICPHRETFKKILNLPANTKIEWKVHEESIQQRITIEESRKEKASQHHRGKLQTQQRHSSQQHQGNGKDHESAQS